MNVFPAIKNVKERQRSPPYPFTMSCPSNLCIQWHLSQSRPDWRSLARHSKRQVRMSIRTAN